MEWIFLLKNVRYFWNLMNSVQHKLKSIKMPTFIQTLPSIKETSMTEARIYVDFNELLESNLVMLSQSDQKLDSDGNTVSFFVGQTVKIYENDIDDSGKEDNLVASGTVELNTHGGTTSPCKWNCRIDPAGIRHASEISAQSE